MQEKTLTGGRSYYLDIARTIAIISISLNHAVNRTYDNYFGQMEEFLESSYLSSLLKSVVTVFSHLGVPLFLMISGALLLHKRMETADDVKRFYRTICWSCSSRRRSGTLSCTGFVFLRCPASIF